MFIQFSPYIEELIRKWDKYLNFRDSFLKLPLLTFIEVSNFSGITGRMKLLIIY